MYLHGNDKYSGDFNILTIYNKLEHSLLAKKNNKTV